MSLDFLGPVKEEIQIQPYKAPAISPFDFINAIHYSKENLIVDDWSEKQYKPFIVNKGLSYGADTVIPANEMNSRPHLDKKLQFSFLINNIVKNSFFLPFSVLSKFNTDYSFNSAETIKKIC